MLSLKVLDTILTDCGSSKQSNTRAEEPLFWDLTLVRAGAIVLGWRTRIERNWKEM
jgi:hypothetical protein